MQSLNRWPANLDMVQSLSGLALVLFVWMHMFFESSILLGKDAMFWVARMFEGEHILGKPYPALVSAMVLVIFMLIAVHAVLALRKMPSSYQQYRSFHRHMTGLQHSDTTLWYVQVITGFAMFFLAGAHLFNMLLQPDQIGPYASADRIWSGQYWILYLLLLVAVHLHAGIGVYRLAMKWGPLTRANTQGFRRRCRQLMWTVIAFFLVLGVITLLTYMKLGYDHRDRAGERYIPEHYQGEGH
jgi:succinate dehydrogenase subunit C